MCRSNEESTTSKRETWSRGTNSRLPFDVNVKLNVYNHKCSPPFLVHEPEAMARVCLAYVEQPKSEVR